MAAAVGTVASLTKDQAISFIKSYGLPALFTAWQAHNQCKEGLASAQKEKAYKEMEKAIPKVMNQIQTKEIKVIPEAFNSSAQFLGQFERAALIALPLILLDIDRAIRLVGQRLESIRDELAIANVARVQGWVLFGEAIYKGLTKEETHILGHAVLLPEL